MYHSVNQVYVGKRVSILVLITFLLAKVSAQKHLSPLTQAKVVTSILQIEQLKDHHADQH